MKSGLHTSLFDVHYSLFEIPFYFFGVKLPLSIKKSCSTFPEQDPFIHSKQTLNTKKQTQKQNNLNIFFFRLFANDRLSIWNRPVRLPKIPEPILCRGGVLSKILRAIHIHLFVCSIAIRRVPIHAADLDPEELLLQVLWGGCGHKTVRKHCLQNINLNPVQVSR